MSCNEFLSNIFLTVMNIFLMFGKVLFCDQLITCLLTTYLFDELYNCCPCTCMPVNKWFWSLSSCVNNLFDMYISQVCSYLFITLF